MGYFSSGGCSTGLRRCDNSQCYVAMWELSSLACIWMVFMSEVTVNSKKGTHADQNSNIGNVNNNILCFSMAQRKSLGLDENPTAFDTHGGLRLFRTYSETHRLGARSWTAERSGRSGGRVTVQPRAVRPGFIPLNRSQCHVCVIKGLREYRVMLETHQHKYQYDSQFGVLKSGSEPKTHRLGGFG